MGKIVPVLLAGFFMTMIGGVFAMQLYWSTFDEPADQPIAFPHDIHAGKLQLDCTTCHVYVEKSKHATVPAVETCMNCHAGGGIESPEIDKLLDYWYKQEPIPWVKIHSMPDHVYFNHARHIKAGVDCATCHGDMTVVQTVKKVRTMDMGFCVGCHRANDAPEDCWTCHN